jgi:villin 1
LNHEDVFILDTALKIFLFSGCNSTIQERAKGLEVVQYIKDNKHGGKCEVATIGWNIYYFSPLPLLELIFVL